MRSFRALPVTLLLLSLLPTAAQDGNQPYFSLSSSKTFAPGDKPGIQMWAQNVDSLEFRVYRIKDPILFFQKLEDVHRFGPGAEPRKARQLTLIERFHRFKANVRAAVRNSFRAQYTADSRQAIHGWLSARDRRPAPAVTSYPGLPLLNPQQVVSVWRQNVNTRRRWDSEGIPIPVEGKGLYLVEAAHQDLRAYTVVVVTDIAILTKTAPGRVLSFVTDRATRAPVADCPLLVWTGRKEAARVRTDSSGLADVRLADVSPDSTMVLARRGDDFAIDSFGNWNLSSEPDRYLTGLVYTDRPVYRPGHTVHWKAIVRSQSGAGYHLPAVRQVSVEILDPEGKPAQRRDATLSANGTVQGDMPVPAAAALGYYSIQVHAGEAEVNGGFHLEEYKKPEYEVRVTPETRRVLQGSPVKALISARYFFGEPVARAKVTYAVHKFRYWYPLYAQEDQDDDNNTGDDYYGQGEQVLEESGQLDADGKLTVSIPTEVSAQRWDMRYRIEARVTDAGNREIAGAATVLATHGSFLVNVQPDRYVYEPGSTAAFTVEARDYDGALIQTEVHGELIEHVWRKPDGPPIQQTDARTDAGGRARISFTVGKGGSYAVRVWANTPQGRQVESRCYIWVTGSAGGWYTGGGERLQIVPDKRTYRPGDIAKVLIVTGVPDAHVLVTAEGRDLYTRQVIKASQPTLRVEVPVKAEYAPNFFLNAAFLLNGKLYQGSKSISVPAVEQQLKVEVTPSRAEFKPGEPALYTITARDWADKPVSAEFSIGVVDEAIYSVRPETTPDIFKFFFGRMYNRVSTSSSLSYYFQGESGKRRMQLANFRSRRNLAQLKPEALVQPKVRKAFPDTALWLASLTTDAAGRAVAKLDFPDSLTTWRATVRGVTRDTKVGAAVNKVIVRKNLMVRLVTPRFFTAGDEVTISVLAHNYLKTEKTARLSLEAKGLEIIDGAARDLKIPVNGDVKADWRVRATVSGEAMLLGKALTNEESDAMELSMPVIPYGVKLSNAQAGTLSGASGGQDVTVTFPEASVPSSRSLQINVTPSVAGAIFGALEYLTTFPYGCTEQTMSSFLPNVIVSQALKELQLKSKVDPAVLGKKVKAGLDRLYDFQHEDGGWGWWQTDESHPFMTAYVAAGLTQARTAGYEVRPEALQKAAEWLRKRLESGRDIAPDSRAYGVYSLVQSGYRQKPVLDAAWELRPKMSAYGIALMGLALDEASDPRAAEAAAMLESRAVSDDREASWPVQQDAMLDFSGDATPEATAYSLKLLTRLRPSSPLLPKAALWLVNHRDQGYYWNSTKQTAMVIFGLTPYLKASGELRPDFGVTVTVNGRQVSSAKFTAADGVSPVSHVIRLPAGELAGGANRIRIARNGEGRLYWSARGEYYSAGDNLAPTGSVSLNLSREYFKMVPSKEGAEIVYQLEPLQGPVQVGDLVAAKLTLTGGAWRYLLVEDPIPAGAEFIEKDELYKIRNQPPWWQRYFSRREYHDDHAAIFQEYFDGKQRQHFYVMKIVNPGRFRISPARVQPMYQPQYLSTTDSRLLEVQ